jgi:ketosteroid isomerase-like protein
METDRVAGIRTAAAIAACALGIGATSDAAPGAASAAQFDRPADVEAIKRIEGKLATLDTMKELIQYYAPDAIVYDMYAPGRYKGTKQIYDNFETQFAAGAGFKSEIRDINVLAHGSLACAAMQEKFDYHMKDGSSGTLTVRQIDAFRKSGGRWRIIQQHISFPMDEKTGMGLLNAPMPVRGSLKWAPDSFAGPAAPVAQAKREVRRWLEVGGISPDLDTLMHYYGPTDDVLVFNNVYPPGEFRGMKEVREGFAPVMNFTHPKIKILDFAVETDGVFAVQIDTQELSITPTGGAEQTFNLRQSDCMRRVDGKWYSVLEALSVPVDAKSGKAVIHMPAIPPP